MILEKNFAQKRQDTWHWQTLNAIPKMNNIKNCTATNGTDFQKLKTVDPDEHSRPTNRSL